MEKFEGKIEPLEGVNIYWENTKIGTVTDTNGSFKIPFSKENTILICSAVGYQTERIKITTPRIVSVLLKEETTLREITINAEKKATSISFREVTNTSNISEKELLKAACCNLSESFNTNPTVDVNFSDAITGTKQIQMLGLTNPYILITQENIPSIRGAAQAFGLTYTPGTWLESIQITKGPGSVVNGYESIAGQINTELKKPSKDDFLFVNIYASRNGRIEFNNHINLKINDLWSTGLYIHNNQRRFKMDTNNDGFMDNPLSNQLNIMNRWEYKNSKGVKSIFNLRYLNDQKQSGQLHFNPQKDKLTTNAWGSEIKTTRVEASNKTAYQFEGTPYKTLSVHTSLTGHVQDAYYGLKQYDIRHKSIYSNINYKSIFWNTMHSFKTGLTATYDDYKEHVLNQSFERTEKGLGAYFEYTYDNDENFSVIAGLRGDSHNLIGNFISPRIHLRYNPWNKTVLKATAGKSRKIASIYAENQHYFASSREFNIENNGGKIYGLDPEVAWNYGMSINQRIKLFGKKGSIGIDYFITNFDNQVVVDVDQNTHEVSFYNLKGSAIAESLQTDFNYTAFKHFNLRFSYKYYNVLIDYKQGALQKGLLARHRTLTNLSYETHLRNAKGSKWKFDTTWNWIGKRRIPNTTDNAIRNQRPSYSKPFSDVSAQITKVFSNRFEMYLGGENLLNVRQENPILGADNPFGADFDSTLLYAPVFGTSVYAGLRLKIN